MHTLYKTRRLFYQQNATYLQLCMKIVQLDLCFARKSYSCIHYVFSCFKVRLHIWNLSKIHWTGSLSLWVSECSVEPSRGSPEAPRNDCQWLPWATARYNINTTIIIYYTKCCSCQCLHLADFNQPDLTDSWGVRGSWMETSLSTDRAEYGVCLLSSDLKKTSTYLVQPVN